MPYQPLAPGVTAPDGVAGTRPDGVPAERPAPRRNGSGRRFTLRRHIDLHRVSSAICRA
ncbi:hypothetical protein [Streptomyces sp. NPDC059783]|uniref:hypothetical protein n=1 Tax=Streptomyces sp. NPDC059783 TaxID=3346944 RepID=UPI0036601315